jgi:hypothetical protein
VFIDFPCVELPGNTVRPARPVNKQNLCGSV